MNLVRYNPWSEMSSLQRRLNRFFDEDAMSEVASESERIP